MQTERSMQQGKKTTIFFLAGFMLCLLIAACSFQPKGLTDDVDSLAAQSTQADARNIKIWPVINSAIKSDDAIETGVEKLLKKMSLEEKVGQILQVELRQITPQDVKDFHIGSILSGGGTYPNNNKYASVADWVAVADAYHQASMDVSDGAVAIPVIWGIDAVHGHSNLFGATVFPHNIGLGATRNPQLIEHIARATAAEVSVTGIDWIFSPTVAVVRNDLWGRSYEGYSEDPDIVKLYAAKMVAGLQGVGGSSEQLDGAHVVATAKHFMGDGGTLNGVDRGDNSDNEQALFDVHGQGYVAALEAGVQTIMASFSSWQGESLHQHEYLLTQVLKQRMGFDGVVISDWNGHSFVEGCTDISCPQAINAGIDVLMVAVADWKILYKNTLTQARDGTIEPSRLDDAVRRLLRVKLRAGLFDAMPTSRPLAAKIDLIGSPAHRSIAQQAVRESLVLLKNKNNILPLDRQLNVLVAGDGADNIGKQSGGWTLSWQGIGNANQDFPGATSIFKGIQTLVDAAGGSAKLSVSGDYNPAPDAAPDVAIIVYGENPYAEGMGDVSSLQYQLGSKRDLGLLKKFKAAGIPVVSIFLSGRPLWVNAELNASDAFVAAWLPGSEGAGIAEVLFKSSAGTIAHDF
ncbi:MAG: beta-glucosidase, partial [Oceanicoccus sp.]